MLAYLDLTVCIDGPDAIPLLLPGWIGEQLLMSNGHLTKTRVTAQTRLTNIERQALKISRNTEIILFTKEWTAEERERDVIG